MFLIILSGLTYFSFIDMIFHSLPALIFVGLLIWGQIHPTLKFFLRTVRILVTLPTVSEGGLFSPLSYTLRASYGLE